MSQVLIDKIRKARETTIYSAGRAFTIRRPTDMEVFEMRGKTITQGDLLRRFVVGWPGMKEIDIINGGSPVDVPFDSELFMAWIEDQPAIWPDLVGAIMAAYEEHQKRTEAAAGEPGPG